MWLGVVHLMSGTNQWSGTAPKKFCRGIFCGLCRRSDFLELVGDVCRSEVMLSGVYSFCIDLVIFGRI